MEDRKKKVALNDELLEKVSGGYDTGDDADYTECAWNFYGTNHEWARGDDGKMTCIYCGVYIN